jgi:hypothetical protein
VSAWSVFAGFAIVNRIFDQKLTQLKATSPRWPSPLEKTLSGCGSHSDLPFDKLRNIELCGLV